MPRRLVEPGTPQSLSRSNVGGTTILSRHQRRMLNDAQLGALTETCPTDEDHDTMSWKQLESQLDGSRNHRHLMLSPGNNKSDATLVGSVAQLPSAQHIARERSKGGGILTTPKKKKTAATLKTPSSTFSATIIPSNELGSVLRAQPSPSNTISSRRVFTYAPPCKTPKSTRSSGDNYTVTTLGGGTYTQPSPIYTAPVVVPPIAEYSRTHPGYLISPTVTPRQHFFTKVPASPATTWTAFTSSTKKSTAATTTTTLSPAEPEVVQKSSSHENENAVPPTVVKEAEERDDVAAATAVAATAAAIEDAPGVHDDNTASVLGLVGDVKIVRVTTTPPKNTTAKIEKHREPEQHDLEEEGIEAPLDALGANASGLSIKQAVMKNIELSRKVSSKSSKSDKLAAAISFGLSQNVSSCSTLERAKQRNKLLALKRSTSTNSKRVTVAMQRSTSTKSDAVATTKPSASANNDDDAVAMKHSTSTTSISLAMKRSMSTTSNALAMKRSMSTNTYAVGLPRSTWTKSATVKSQKEDKKQAPATPTIPKLKFRGTLRVFGRLRKTSEARQAQWLTMVQQAIREAQGEDLSTVTDTAALGMKKNKKGVDAYTNSIVSSQTDSSLSDDESGVFSDPESDLEDELYENGNNGTGFYHHALARLSLKDLGMSHDDASVSSIELLFQWLTCGNKLPAAWSPRHKSFDPRGMVITTSSDDDDDDNDSDAYGKHKKNSKRNKKNEKKKRKKGGIRAGFLLSPRRRR